MGKIITSSPIVFLPANAVVDEGDFISSTEKGYEHTFEVTRVDYPLNMSTEEVDHVEAHLKVVTKRG